MTLGLETGVGDRRRGLRRPVGGATAAMVISSQASGSGRQSPAKGSHSLVQIGGSFDNKFGQVNGFTGRVVYGSLVASRRQAGPLACF